MSANPSATHQRAESVVLAEPKERRPVRNVTPADTSRVGNRPEQGAEEGRPLGSVPGRQRHASSWHDHSGQLVRGALGFAHVQDHKVADRRVERRIGERNVGSRALYECGIGIPPRRKLDHGRRDVEPDSRRPTRNRSRRDVARTSSDVENAHACSDACSVE